MRLKFHSRFITILLLGFFSGLPLALTASTLTAWLADANVERAAIGLFAAVATPYALKFLWAPLIDGIRLPWLGRRRGWLLATQIALALSIALMGFTNPAINPWLTGLSAVLVAVCSATQDIVIDAYRVELLPPEEQGTGAALITFGYRIGMLISGAGALALADILGWKLTYFAMAALAATSICVTLFARESSEKETPSPTTDHRSLTIFFRNYVIDPFRDFMTRPNWLAVLAFVVLYKLGDAFMGVMFNPFLLDIGFTKTDIATVVKLYGLAATLIGTFVGGFMVAHAGNYRALMLGGFLHMLTNLLLVLQARIGADVHFLAFSVGLENFTGGISTAAFIAYLASLTRTHYTATQYALLSSLAAFGRTWLSTPSGTLAQQLGWEHFFALASLMAVPGLVLLWWLERSKRRLARI